LAGPPQRTWKGVCKAHLHCKNAENISAKGAMLAATKILRKGHHHRIGRKAEAEAL